MELIYNLIFIIIIGITSSWFTKLIDYCFNDGNIFDWYYQIISKIKNPKLFKLLGGCYICFNVWISTCIFQLFQFILGIHSILFIPFIATSFIMSYIISKKDKNTINEVKPKKRTYISYIKTNKIK